MTSNTPTPARPALDAMAEEMTKPASDMVAWLRRTCSSRKISKVFGCDNFGCVYCRAARQIVADAEDIAKQRRSLADMRGALQEIRADSENWKRSATTAIERDICEALGNHASKALARSAP